MNLKYGHPISWKKLSTATRLDKEIQSPIFLLYTISSKIIPYGNWRSDPAHKPTQQIEIPQNEFHQVRSWIQHLLFSFQIWGVSILKWLHTDRVRFGQIRTMPHKSWTTTLAHIAIKGQEKRKKDGKQIKKKQKRKNKQAILWLTFAKHQFLLSLRHTQREDH